MAKKNFLQRAKDWLFGNSKKKDEDHSKSSSSQYSVADKSTRETVKSSTKSYQQNKSTYESRASERGASSAGGYQNRTSRDNTASNYAKSYYEKQNRIKQQDEERNKAQNSVGKNYATNETLERLNQRYGSGLAQKKEEEKKEYKTPTATLDRLNEKYGTGVSEESKALAKSTGKVAKGSVLQALGGDLKSIGTDSNEYDQQKRIIEDAYVNERITKAQRDKQIEMLDKSALGKKYKGWEDTEGHKRYQSIAQYGQKLNEKGDKLVNDEMEGANGLKKAYLSAVNSGTGMAMDAAFGAVTGGAGLAHMGMRVYGNEIDPNEKYATKPGDEGRTRLEAERYAGGQAFKEVGTEAIFSGVGLARGVVGGKGAVSLADKLADKVAGKIANKGRKELAYQGVKLAAGTAEESSEEIIGWLLDPVINNMAQGDAQANRSGKTVRAGLEESAQDMMKAMSNMSEEEARAFVANLGSDLKQQYIDGGASEDEAEKMSQMTADYLAAKAAGNEEAAENYQNQIVDQMVGSQGFKQHLDLSELKDTLASTVLLTASTGGAAAIKNSGKTSEVAKSVREDLKNSFGPGGLAELTKKVINSDDASMSARAQSMLEHIESGNDISDSQVVELYEATQKQAEVEKDRARASRQTATKAIERNGDMMPISTDADGNITQMGARTAQIFDSARENAGKVISDDEALNVLPEEDIERVKTAIAGYQTGAFTIDMADELTIDNPEARTAFEKVTGESLPVIANRDGSVNTVRTNVATKEYLYANAANNLAETAAEETRHFKDVRKGQIDTGFTLGMGKAGRQMYSDISNGTDVLNEMTYRGKAIVAATYYEAAKGGNYESFEEYQRVAGSHPGFNLLSIEQKRQAYEAGIMDARQEMLPDGTVVTEGDVLKLDNSYGGRGTVIVEGTAALTASLMNDLNAIASRLNVTIHYTDNLVAGEMEVTDPETGEKTVRTLQANGMYQNGEIWINSNEDITMGIESILTHELTHHIAKFAPEEYSKLEKMVVDAMEEKMPGRLEAMIKERMALYDNTEQKLDEDTVKEEIIADLAYEMLGDTEFVQEICENEPALGRAILNAIRDVLSRIRQMLAAGFDNKYIENSVLGQLGVMKEFERTYLEGLHNAAMAEANAIIGVDNNADSKYSITQGMTEEERFNELKDKSLNVVEVSGNTSENAIESVSESELDVLLNGRLSEAKNAAVKVAKRLGIVGTYEKRDNIDLKFDYSGNGINESAQKQMAVASPGVFLRYLHASENISSIIENAILLKSYTNEEYLRDHPGHRKNGGNIKMSHVLISAYADSENIVPIKLTIQEAVENRNPKLKVMIALDTIPKNKISEGLSGEPDYLDGNQRSIATSLTYNLADILREVKNSEHYQAMDWYIPDQFKDLKTDHADIRFSISAQDSKGNMLSEEQQEYFKDSKVVDEYGNLIPMYHGTNSYGFTIFDRGHGDPEGNSGAGFYFSNTQDDSDANYGSRDGADITSKIDRLAENILNIGEWKGEEVDSQERAEEIARQELQSGDTGVYKVYLNTVKPYYRDGKNSTNLYDIIEGEFDESVIDKDDYDSEDEYFDDLYNYKAESNYEVVDNAVRDAFRMVEDTFGEVDTYASYNDIVGSIVEAMEGESLTWDDVNQVFEEAEAFIYDATTGDGKYVAPEMTRAFIEALGFDSIIDNEVGEKFGNMKGMTADTQHIIVFKADQIKNVDNTTPTHSTDIRFSISPKERNSLYDSGLAITEGGSVAKFSLSSWEETDVAKLKNVLSDAGYEQSRIDKWISDVNSVAAVISGDKRRLDYIADRNQPALKPNSEYYYTLDLSTLCAKRRLYQGTYNAIMHRLVNKALTPEDTIRLRAMMNDLGYEVPCGICYEESRKKNEGIFAQRWLNGYGKRWKGYKNMEHEDPYVPTLADVTTTDGRARLEKEHPEALESYLKYQKTRGSANPKVSFTHTDYRGDILNMTKGDVEKVKHIGGLRVQSFSDFEIPHVIDMMQAVMDMSAMSLTAQAYTKVPAFADIFGGTGIKINLSLIGKYNPETQELEFDSKEGIDPDEAFRIRNKYSENVGTIIVGSDDASILAAWADPRIDMVIPFHRSGWKVKEFEKLGLTGYKDYQKYQSERYLDGSKNGMALSKASKKYGEKLEGIYAEDYWDYSKTGKENAEAYLELCKQKKYRPVFYNFLHDNGDGSWSLKEDGSTDGYWKSLVDFKMYNNLGVGAPQQLVEPEFDMDAAQDVMDAYEGGADTLPVAHDVVEKFVEGKEQKKFSVSLDNVKSAQPATEDDAFEYIADNSEEFDEVEMPYQDRLLEESRQRRANIRAQVHEYAQNRFKQLKLTYDAVLKKGQYHSEAMDLVMSVMSNSDTTKKYKSEQVTFVEEGLAKIFNLAKTEKWAEASNLSVDIAAELIENVDFIEDNQFERYKEMRDYFKSQKLYLPKEERSNFSKGYSEFVKANAGWLKVTSDSSNVSVDQIWEEAKSEFPEFIEGEPTSQADMLMAFADAMDVASNYKIAYSSEEAYELIGTIANDLIEIVAPDEGMRKSDSWKSFADKKKEAYDKKTKAMKQRHKEAMDDVKAKLKDKNAELRKANRNLKKTSQKLAKNEFKQSEKKRLEKRKAYAARIGKDYAWLSSRLLKPTDDKHIPEGFRKELADLLQQFDFQTDRSKALEEKYGRVSNKTFKMHRLRDELREIAAEDDSGPFLYDGYAFQLMDALSKKLDGKPVDQLDDQDIKDISIILKYIRKNIQNYNQAFSDAIQQHISELADATFDSINKRVERRGKAGKRGKAWESMSGILNESMVTPIDMFEQFGGGLETVYKQGLRRGFDRHVQNIDFIRENVFAEVLKEYRSYEVKNWKGKTKTKGKKLGKQLEAWRDDSQLQEFELLNGEKISINPAQIMSLYCLSKREQAMGHILGSGIVLTEVDAKSVVKDAIGVKKKISEVEKKIISYPDIIKITSALTEEQKRIADQLMNVLNTTCSEWGNETSMKLYGYRKFTEENYFPIKSADSYLDASFEGRTSEERIRNFGFTKGTVVNANNPIVIDDFFTVVADHINKMSMYNAFAAPIADMQRLFNYKVRDDNGLLVASVREQMQSAFGDRGVNYFTKFMADLNGNTNKKSDGLSKVIDSSLSNYKKAAVGGNIRVALQQPTAIIRAFAVIDPKYLTLKGVSMKRMHDMCAIAKWKNWGNYDANMTRDLEDIMMDKQPSFLDKYTMDVYGKLDDATWSIIFASVEKEVQATHPELEFDSPEYRQVVSDRASEVFDKTQVVDSVFHRSQAMRNKENDLVKVVTAFKAEPTRTYNMIRSDLIKAYDAHLDGDNSKASKLVARMFTVFAMNVLVTQAAASLADIIRQAGKGGDDDDEETYLQILLDNLFGFHDLEGSVGRNMLSLASSNMSPLTTIYGVSDFLSFTQGWSSSNMAFEGWEGLGKAVNELVKFGEGGSNKSLYEVTEMFVDSLGYITGIPTKNAKRDIGSMAKVILKFFGKETFAAELETAIKDTASIILGSKSGSQGYYGDTSKKGSGGTSETTTSETTRPYQTVSVSKPSTGSENKLIKDGTKTDKLLNRFGLNLTDDEKAQREYDKQIAEVQNKLEEYKAKKEKNGEAVTKEQLNKQLWSYCSKNYTDALTMGDVESVKAMKQLYLDCGGNAAYVEKQIKTKTKTAFTKTIGNREFAGRQIRLRNFMREELGMTDEDISEIVRSSDTAKKLKAGFRTYNQDRIFAAAVQLYEAGITDADIEYLYKYRNTKSEAVEKYAEIYKYSTGYAVPCTGTITSYFGHRNAPTAGASSNHQAIDIAAPIGTNVGAAMSGKVVYAGWYGGYGNQVVVEHPDGTQTYYSHLSAINVEKGQMVNKNDSVGAVGSTGVSTGPHLDFKVRVNGSWVDPLKFIDEKQIAGR